MAILTIHRASGTIGHGTPFTVGEVATLVNGAWCSAMANASLHHYYSTFSATNRHVAQATCILSPSMARQEERARDNALFTPFVVPIMV